MSITIKQLRYMYIYARSIDVITRANLVHSKRRQFKRAALLNSSHNSPQKAPQPLIAITNANVECSLTHSGSLTRCERVRRNKSLTRRPNVFCHSKRSALEIVYCLLPLLLLLLHLLLLRFKLFETQKQQQRQQQRQRQQFETKIGTQHCQVSRSRSRCCPSPPSFIFRRCCCFCFYRCRCLFFCYVLQN